MNDSNNPLARLLVTRLIKKGTEMTESISEVVKTEGLTIQQFNVLRILRGRKGKAASLQDVSGQMIHSNSNTTRVIDKLIIKEYVDRIQCPSDRRQIELTITPRGLKVLERLDHIIDTKEAMLTKGLNTIEIQQVLNFLSKM